MKSSKGSVVVCCVRGNLRLRLPRGLWTDKKQVYLSLGLTDNLANRKAAEIKAKQIELDILSGHFDPTLKKYQPITYNSNSELKVFNSFYFSRKLTMLFQIGDRVAFKFDRALTYGVENLDKKNNKILLRVEVPRDYCLAFGWDDANQYTKIPRLAEP